MEYYLLMNIRNSEYVIVLDEIETLVSKEKEHYKQKSQESYTRIRSYL